MRGAGSSSQSYPLILFTVLIVLGFGTTVVSNPPDSSERGESSRGYEDAGACCYGTGGSCGMVTESECGELAGSFKGIGTDCAEMVCRGACCMGPHTCNEERAAVQCSLGGGTYQGDGTTCLQPDIECPPNGGACCVDGVCRDIILSACADLGGTVVGLGTPCSWVVSCSPLVRKGACCLADGNCTITTLDQCGQAGGTFHGEGEPCRSDTCVGACCTDSGCISRVNRSTCIVSYAGAFHGIGTKCSDEDIPCPMGGCCYSWGCWQQSESTCNIQNGTFLGPNSTCSGAMCTGACCYGNSSYPYCYDESPAMCRGEFLGLGTTCAATPCRLMGACCFPDQSCEEISEEGCAQREGKFLGVESHCDYDYFTYESICPGACCAFSSSACTDNLAEEHCKTQFDGVFQGPGTRCTDDSIACPATIGACCIYTWNTGGTFDCFNAFTEFECTQSQGTFSEHRRCDQVECSQVRCPGEGDCCSPHRGVGCNDEKCCAEVCAADPNCCSPNARLVWDDVCVSLADRLCGETRESYCAPRVSDLNGDGEVNLRDYQIFQAGFAR